MRRQRAEEGPNVDLRTLSNRLGLSLHRRVALGHAMPGLFHVIGAAEIAKVSLPVAVLIWLMINPASLQGAPPPSTPPTLNRQRDVHDGVNAGSASERI